MHRSVPENGTLHHVDSYSAGTTEGEMGVCLEEVGDRNQNEFSKGNENEAM